MKKPNPGWLLFVFVLVINITGRAQTLISSFGSNPGLINAYKYIPANMPANAPLVLVLHGCGQTASSYSLETQWNDLADRQKFYVAYGEQTSANNNLDCFNYFLTADASRGQGEALSLKQITDYMKANYSIDTTRVFVTGLSAGAAMTAVMCACYPDIFAAGAEMSGLPYGCATSSTGASLACLGEVSNTPQVWGNYARAQNPGYTGNWPRMAIFQGSADETVNIENSTEMIKQWTNLHGISQTPGYTNTSFNGNALIQLDQFFDSTNHVPVEFYEIMNMAHGTAVYPGTCYQQGGATDILAFNEEFYSPFWAAQFFGILQLPYSINGLSSVAISQQGLTYSVPNATGSVYTWTVPAGVTIVTGQGTNSITVNWGTASGTVYVTEMPTGGCEQGPVSLYVAATSPAPLTADAGVRNITAPAANICSASFTPSFTLTNAGTDTLTSVSIYYAVDNNAYQNYTWTGSLLHTQSVLVTLPAVSTSAGNHVLTIYCTSPDGDVDANLANDTVRKSFTVGVTPVVNLGNNITQCGGTATLDAQNTGDTYLWTGGAVSQTDTVSQSGTYSVTVTSNGCSASGSVNVTINSVPVINLNGGNVCASQLVLDAGNSGDAFRWSTTATTQTITATTSGNYSVTVTNTNNCSSSGSVTVNLNTAPAINLGAGGNVCGTSASLDAGNSGASFLWSTGATTQSINATNSGQYSVTVTGGINCSSSATVNINLDTVPMVNLSGGTVCGGSLALDAGNSGSGFHWSNGATTQSISATTSGSYLVTVTAVDNCTASASANVVINPLPNVSLQLSPDTICENFGAVTLQGENPPGGVFSGQDVSAGIFNASGAGTYAITYVYTDSNNCPASATENMVVDVCTSISSVEENQDVNIFPNPNATGVLNVRTNGLLQNLKLKVFDVTGGVVMEQSITEANAHFDISLLSRGIYLVSVEGGGLVQRKKLIIQ